MKALFIPLNHYIYNHDKYVGMIPITRWILANSKSYRRILNYTIFYPIRFILMMAMSITGLTILLLSCLFGKGRKASDWIKANLDRRKNSYFDVQQRFSPFYKNEFQIVVYYSSNQIPKSNWRKKIFEKRLTEIKSKFKTLEIACADNTSDILNIIRRNNIDVSQSIFFLHQDLNFPTVDLKAIGFTGIRS